jgi:carotenoid cleavage dioxygenase
MEVLFPHSGVLSRQDDRYHTVPYSVGFMRCLDPTLPLDPRLAGAPFRPYNTWTRFEHVQRRVQSFFAGADSGLQECCFVPRSARAAEGDGYLVGVADRPFEARSDLLILDAQRLSDGPLANVRMPFRIYAQIHGWWVSAEQRRTI